MGAFQSHSTLSNESANVRPQSLEWLSHTDCLEIQMSLTNVRSIILAMLARCEVPYAVKPYDQFLHDRCVAVCEERGYPIGLNSGPESNIKHDVEHKPTLLPFLPTGVCIASATYGYLKTDMPRLIYIALFTAFATYLDDFFKSDVESVALFRKRLTRGERQGHPMLDGLADLLNHTDTAFGHTAANMIVQDALGYLNSLLLDYETQSLIVRAYCVVQDEDISLLTYIGFYSGRKTQKGFQSICAICPVPPRPTPFSCFRKTCL